MDITRMIIAPTENVSAALVRMGESGEKILFVTDSESRLLGTLTDGDVRRSILRGEPLDLPVSGVMNESPVTVEVGHAREDVEHIMVDRHVDVVPVLEGSTVVDAVRWLDLFNRHERQKPQIGVPVVIMAGGLGSRLGPFTKVLPKPLLPLGETPVVQVIMDRFAEYGCVDFRLSVNYKAALIKAYFADSDSGYSVSYVQEDSPLGTAGSLRLLIGTFDTPFFLTNCDVIVRADYADVMVQHREHGNAITVVSSMRNFTIPYGVCEGMKDGRIERIVEKPGYDLLVSTGMAVVEPHVLDRIPEGSVYHFTDLVNDSVAAGDAVGVYPIGENGWLDMGQWEQYQETLLQFGPGW